MSTPAASAPAAGALAVSARLDSPATSRFPALGTTVEVMVTEPQALPVAERVVREHLRAIDAAASRFRPDSELSRLQQRAGAAVAVSPLLFEALTVALRAAELTDGLVDPTVGRAVCALGYDRDFHVLDRDQPLPVEPAGPAPGWWRVRLTIDGGLRQVTVPRGVQVDLGATVKAWVADRAAAEAASDSGCGVLVGVGGDIAVAGPAPADGWPVTVTDGQARSSLAPHSTISIRSAAVATSGIASRTWVRGGRRVHHIVDPRTGDVPELVWRAVSVAAATCADANTASTAAMVMGAEAPEWLARRRLPARLVGADGGVTLVAGWPAEGTT